MRATQAEKTFSFGIRRPRSERGRGGMQRLPQLWRWITLLKSTCDSLSSWAAGTKPTAGSEMSET